MPEWLALFIRGRTIFKHGSQLGKPCSIVYEALIKQLQWVWTSYLCTLFELLWVLRYVDVDIIIVLLLSPCID